MKIPCPGCTARRLEMNTAPCEICGHVNEITPPSREKMHPFARLMRALLAPLGRVFSLLTAIFCFFALWSMALNNIRPFFGIAELGLIFSGLLVISIWLTRLATRAAVYLFAPTTRQIPDPALKVFSFCPFASRFWHFLIISTCRCAPHFGFIGARYKRSPKVLF